MRKIIYLIAGLVIMFAIMKQCEGNNDDKFRAKIQKLENQLDSLKLDTQNKLLKIDQLNDSITLKNIQIVKYDSIIDSIKNKRNETKDNVDNYSDFQLDSILTNYRHPNKN